jgi:hypothetical protein
MTIGMLLLLLILERDYLCLYRNNSTTADVLCYSVGVTLVESDGKRQWHCCCRFRFASNP